jgi:hypothetical protein
MKEILTKVQVDLDNLQKTLKREGEVLISKITDAANKAASNKSVVAKKQKFEKLVDSQIKKIEPAFDKFYSELKVTAGRYGVNLDKLEKRVKSTTEKAVSRLNLKTKAPLAKTKAAVEKPMGSGGSNKKSTSTGISKKKNSKKTEG